MAANDVAVETPDTIVKRMIFLPWWVCDHARMERKRVIIASTLVGGPDRAQ
jgi:hypothetical protein